MSMQDTIADMLTRVRNAQMIEHDSVKMPSSKIKKNIAQVLMEEGFIESFEESGTTKKSLSIKLKYYDGKPVIELIKRVSKPSLRIYQKKDEIPKVNGGLGLAIVSTSKGIMSDKKARQLGCGGEVLCIVA